MNVEIEMPAYWGRMCHELTAGMRHKVHSLCGEDLHLLVVKHLKRIKRLHHTWSRKLGAAPTHHFDKGIEGAAWTADENGAEVVIPMPGLSRAFHDIELTTPTKNGASAYTIPISKHAYGHKVYELERMGWKVFKAKAKDEGEGVLMGVREKRGGGVGGESGGEAEALYLLRKRVRMQQDRSLLPSDAEMGNTVVKAIMKEHARVMRKAG